MQRQVAENPKWWKRRTRLEKKLLISTSIVCLIGLVLVISLIIVSNRKSTRSGFLVTADETCQSSECAKTASQFLSNMNPFADPCDDFYEFACGNFIENTNIPEDKTKVSAFSILDDQVNVQLRNILEEQEGMSDPRAFLLTRKFYNVCLNESAIEKHGLTKMQNYLTQLGGWPVLEGIKWKEENFDWKNLTYDLKRLGFNFYHILPIYLTTDSKNTSKYILELTQSTLDLPREYLIKNMTDEVLQAYQQFMFEVAVLFGADEDIAKKEMKDAFEFQRKLANISLPAEELRNVSKTYNPYKIEDLQKKFPSIPWLQYINNILHPSVEVDKNEIVIIQAPQFISQLEKLLQYTPKRIISNYMLWVTIKKVISALPVSLQNARLKFESKFYGITENEPRWKQCAENTYDKFDLSTAALFVREYFDRESKKKALDLVKDVQNTFIDILKSLDWMDEKTKERALEKAKLIIPIVGYPDELLDDKILDEFYNQLNSSDNYLEYLLLINVFSNNVTFDLLRKPVNKTNWIFHGGAATVNAYYNVNENSIIFPAAILQGIFFERARPNYVNYGAIGFVIGHEITHGFDDEGRQFDQDGMLVNWWTPATEHAFLAKAECIIEQYSSYIVPEINQTINGIITQGENIADNGGLKLAYFAYRKWAESQPEPEPTLPGFAYTPRQMFWLSTANVWCSVEREDALKLSVATNVHSPSKFRVNGPMSNLKEFSEDFQCPQGSKMNPGDKCVVW